MHPSRPHLCASGSSGGSLAVWDLRFQAPPALHALQEDTAGDVWQVSLVSFRIFPLARALQVMRLPVSRGLQALDERWLQHLGVTKGVASALRTPASAVISYGVLGRLARLLNVHIPTCAIAGHG